MNLKKDKDSLIICVLMRIWASSWISTAFISLGVNCSKIGIEIHIFGLSPCIEKAAGIDFSVKYSVGIFVPIKFEYLEAHLISLLSFVSCAFSDDK